MQKLQMVWSYLFCGVLNECFRYMTEIIPDLVKYYPPEILPSAAWGRLVHKESNKCVDFSKRPVSVSNCPILPEDHRMDLQLTWNEDIRQGQTAESAQDRFLLG